MKKFAISAIIASAILGSAAQAATPVKTQDPVKQECHKQNPKDHKGYLKCVADHSKAAAPATTGTPAPAGK